MNQGELLKFMREEFDEMIALAKRKNSDYANAQNEGADAFKNLNIVEMMDVCACETGIFVRMSDKYSRLATFSKVGVMKVKDESVEDTLRDLIVYSLLMKARMKERKSQDTPGGS